MNERVLEKILSVRKNSLLRTDGFNNKKGFPLVGKLREAVMRGKVACGDSDINFRGGNL